MLLVDEPIPEIPAPAPEPGVTTGTSGGPPIGGGEEPADIGVGQRGQGQKGNTMIAVNIESNYSFWSWFLGLFA